VGLRKPYQYRPNDAIFWWKAASPTGPRMGTTLNQFISEPERCLHDMCQAQAGVSVDRHWRPRLGGYVVDMTFAPPPELVAYGYVDERGRMSIAPNADVYSFPLGRQRPWKHRYPFQPDHGSCNQLCLWFPGDPPPLRWEWSDGLEDYVSRVHRHLFYEECWRRTGDWPAEDAPHGAPGNQLTHSDGTPTHPIISTRLLHAVNELAKT